MAERCVGAGPVEGEASYYVSIQGPGDPVIGENGQVCVVNVKRDLCMGSFDAIEEATTASDVELIVTKANNPGPDYQAFLTAECRVLFRPGTLCHPP